MVSIGTGLWFKAVLNTNGHTGQARGILFYNLKFKVGDRKGLKFTSDAVKIFSGTPKPESFSSLHESVA